MYLRNSICQERLNPPAMLHIHRDLDIYAREVIDHLSRKHLRRMNLLDILNPDPEKDRFAAIIHLVQTFFHLLLCFTVLNRLYQAKFYQLAFCNAKAFKHPKERDLVACAYHRIHIYTPYFLLVYDVVQ